MTRPRLLFVSTRFLFPIDSGGKIRTCQILRGLKGRAYEITLLSPASAGQLEAHGHELKTICDQFVSWEAPPRSWLFKYARLRHVLSSVPIPIRTDLDRRGVRALQAAMAQSPDVVVFDFLHACILAPPRIDVPSVLFTHNVEAEIFARHREHARDPIRRLLWQSQHRKMRDFEGMWLRRFDAVVAVSERDASTFIEQYRLSQVHTIPTGVDFDYFSYSPPAAADHIVFLGSMDWLANQDAIVFFMDEIWPWVVAKCPDVRMSVVGRAPPATLVNRAMSRGLRWTFTGYVDDVRPHVRGAAVCVVPIRVAGGTRLKVFEAMAMGVPVVSTGVGTEGLPIRSGEDYIRADDPRTFAEAIVQLLGDATLRMKLSATARGRVEERFSYREASRAFEVICDAAIQRWSASRGQLSTHSGVSPSR